MIMTSRSDVGFKTTAIRSWPEANRIQRPNKQTINQSTRQQSINQANLGGIPLCVCVCVFARASDSQSVVMAQDANNVLTNVRRIDDERDNRFLPSFHCLC